MMGLTTISVATNRRYAAQAEVWIFFLAIILVNTAFVAFIAEDVLPKSLFPRGRFLLLGAVLAAVVFLSRGFWATIDLVRPLTVWRINPVWFLVAALWPILFSVGFVIAKILVTGGEWQIVSPGIGLLTQPRLLTTIFIAALVGEIVWVGYAIRNLGHHYPKTVAALLTGTAWALWWLPMAYYQIGIVPGLSMVGLWMNMVGIAFFCTFFYTLTGSGLVIFAMQFCFNSSILAFPVLPRSGGPWTYEVYSALYMVVGFLFVTVLMPRLQARRAAA